MNKIKAAILKAAPFTLPAMMLMGATAWNSNFVPPAAELGIHAKEQTQPTVEIVDNEKEEFILVDRFNFDGSCYGCEGSCGGCDTQCGGCTGCISCTGCRGSCEDTNMPG